MVARIVQLSDLHLTDTERTRAWGSRPWVSLRRVLDHLEASPTSPDVLVVTGDVASKRRPATYQRLRAWLAPWRERLCILPGNHDHRGMLRAAFDEHILPGPSHVHFVRDVGDWRLIGLDSLRRFHVHGRLGDEQRAWLAHQLDSTERPVFLFFHHPPIRVDCWWLDKDLLRDRDELAAILAGRQVRAIASGHVHQPTHGTFAGAEVWTCPSTAYQFKPHSIVPGPSHYEPAYRVFELDDLTVRSHVVDLRYSDA